LRLRAKRARKRVGGAHGDRGGAGARLAFAGLAIAAVVAAITAHTGSLGNFFSYFTIDSNLLAIVVLLAGGLVNPQGRGRAYLRGAATLFMVITGIVYAVSVWHRVSSARSACGICAVSVWHRASSS
jgi:hypothetical protein